MISAATGRQPYFVGKPNPMMIRSALNRIDAHSETTVMVGDRMDTDVVAGIEAGPADVPGAVRVHAGWPTSSAFPFRPTEILDSVQDLIGRV